MATNLRLRSESADAVRREAKRSGRSQQDVIRAAIDTYLGVNPPDRPAPELELLAADGAVRRPRIPFRRAAHRIRLPSGVTTTDLLERVDRI